MAGYGEGFLNRLCQEGKLQEVQDYINKLDASTLAAKLCHSAGPLQYTPLHEAAANGHTSLVDLLVTCGADINCRSKGGHTPLHLAAKWGHSETVQILLRYKADLSLTDGFRKTAKQVAEANSKGSVVRVLYSEGNKDQAQPCAFAFFVRVFVYVCICVCVHMCVCVCVFVCVLRSLLLLCYAVRRWLCRDCKGSRVRVRATRDGGKRK